MQTLPEPRDAIREKLSSFMSDEEVEKFANFDYALSVVKQGQLCWQAPVSIAIHALYDPLGQNAAQLQELIGHALEPLEALLESLQPKKGEEPLQDERARMLFHTRFALGFVLLAKGDKQRSQTILHQMAATKLSKPRNVVHYGLVHYGLGPGVLRATVDLLFGKYVIALVMKSVYEIEENYSAALYLLTEAAACLPEPVLATEAVRLLDHWAAQEESFDASQEYEFPSLDWLFLFGEAGRLLACACCDEADLSEVEVPNLCKVESPQFLAWKFGQLAGRFAYNDPRWRETPLEKLHGPLGFLEDQYNYDNYEREFLDEAWQAWRVMAGLLCEYDSRRDWQQLRKHYLAMWQDSNRCSGMSLIEVTPNTDLYWAIRIGFADKVLEVMAQVPAPVETPEPERDIESTILQIVQSVAIRQLKIERTSMQILDRLPRSKQETRQHVQEHLIDVWNELPSAVVNHLLRAERDYRTEENDDLAKLGFCKAVEASLHNCFVQPLVDFRQKQSRRQIGLCFSPPRGLQQVTASQLGKLSLGEWASILETLASPRSRSLAALGTYDLQQFTAVHLGGPHLPDLRPLSRSLALVQQYRSGSAHFQDADSRYSKGKRELEEMRGLVLGIDKPSVITLIFKLLGAKKTSAGN